MCALTDDFAGHIGWHTEEGFALQFIERYDEIASMYNSTTLESGCSAWEDYAADTGITDDGSGV